MLEEVDALSDDLMRVRARTAARLAARGRRRTPSSALRDAVDADRRVDTGSPRRLHDRSTIARRPCRGGRTSDSPHSTEGTDRSWKSFPAEAGARHPNARRRPGPRPEPARQARDPRRRPAWRCSSARSTRRSSGRRCRAIVTDLGGNELYTWVVTIYLLTSTITVPFYGKLSDLYGRKPMLMIGVTLFLLGSALSGLQPEHGAADPVPRHPGPRRRRAVPDRARGHRRPVHAGRARQVPGPVRRRLRHLVHHRPGARRLPDRQRQLALDLLRQPARSASSACSSSGACCRRSSEPAPPATSTTSARASSRSPSALLLVGLTNKQTGDWTDARGRRPASPSASSSARCSCSSSRGPRSRSSRSTCSATGPTRRRSSRRSWSASASSARSSSCRAGSSSSSGVERDRLGLPDLPAAHRADRQLDRRRASSSSRTGRYKAIILAALVRHGRRHGPA